MANASRAHRSRAPGQIALLARERPAVAA
jgi:hypothetical protein